MAVSPLTTSNPIGGFTPNHPGQYVFLIKPADETRANPGVTDDATLQFPVSGGATYEFAMRLFYIGTYNGVAVSNLQYQLVGPAVTASTGFSMMRRQSIPGQAGESVLNQTGAYVQAFSAAPITAGGTAFGGGAMLEQIGFFVPNADGTVILKWNGTLAGNNCTLKKGSYFRYKKLHS